MSKRILSSSLSEQSLASALVFMNTNSSTQIRTMAQLISLIVEAFADAIPNLRPSETDAKELLALHFGSFQTARAPRITLTTQKTSMSTHIKNFFEKENKDA